MRPPPDRKRPAAAPLDSPPRPADRRRTFDNSRGPPLPPDPIPPANEARRRALRAAGAAMVLAGLVLAHLAAARGLWRAYPYSYSWSELLIDYQGGFAKRGLLGELAFQLRGLISPRLLVVGAVCGAYILAAAGAVLTLRLADGFAGLMFLLSPAGGLFPPLNPEGYGRKDAFVQLALVAGMGIAGRARRRWFALLAPMAVFAVAGLLVEIAWFYYPLVLAAALALRRSEPLRWRLGAAAAGAAYAGGCLALTLAAPRVDTAAIARSWGGVPFDTDATGALCCLNLRFAEAAGIARATLPNAGGYAIGLLLGLAPIALLLIRRPPRRADALTHAAALAGAVAATAPVFVAADWGRYIALWLWATFLYAWVVGRAGPAPPVRPLGAEGWALRGLLVALYAGTWQLAYYQTPDRSALLPGALFKAVRSAGPDAP